MFLVLRLEAILIGALCAVAAAWCIFPIRTEAVIRRRLADALAALDDVVAHATCPQGERTEKYALFEHRMMELLSVAAPVQWHLRLFAFREGLEHPARWIALTEGICEHAQPFVSRADVSERQCGTVRRAIGASRRAIAGHGKPDAPPDTLPVTVSLSNVHDALAMRRS